jgi:hypothetical protein
MSKTYFALLASLTGIVAAFSMHSSSLQGQASCIGKPYGYPGCPVKEEDVGEAEVAAPVNCGDSVLDNDEECDLGRFNGLTSCTEDCRLLYCGDGETTGFIGEECEPEIEEIYIEEDDGSLTTELRYVQKSCGSICSIPDCDEEGNCSGGCVTSFRECEEEEVEEPLFKAHLQLLRNKTTLPSTPTLTVETVHVKGTSSVMTETTTIETTVRITACSLCAEMR